MSLYFKMHIKLYNIFFQIIDSRKDIGSAEDHQTYLDLEGIQVILQRHLFIK